MRDVGWLHSTNVRKFERRAHLLHLASRLYNIGYTIMYGSCQLPHVYESRHGTVLWCALNVTVPHVKMQCTTSCALQVAVHCGHSVI